MHETVKGLLVTRYLRGSWFFVDEGKHVFASTLLLFTFSKRVTYLSLFRMLGSTFVEVHPKKAL